MTQTQAVIGTAQYLARSRRRPERRRPQRLSTRPAACSMSSSPPAALPGDSPVAISPPARRATAGAAVDRRGVGRPRHGCGRPARAQQGPGRLLPERRRLPCRPAGGAAGSADQRRRARHGCRAAAAGRRQPRSSVGSEANHRGVCRAAPSGSGLAEPVRAPSVRGAVGAGAGVLAGWLGERQRRLLPSGATGDTSSLPAVREGRDRQPDRRGTCDPTIAGLIALAPACGA